MSECIVEIITQVNLLQISISVMPVIDASLTLVPLSIGLPMLVAALVAASRRLSSSVPPAIRFLILHLLVLS